MRYFKYQISKPMSKVWSLFSDLGGIDKQKLYGNSDSHTIEIIESAVRGNIVLTDDFNLLAYEKRCQENDKFNRSKDVSKCVNIVDDASSDDDMKVGYGDISNRRLSSYLDIEENDFDKVESSTSFEESVRKLYEVREKYIIESGVDLVTLIKGALNGIPEALSEIRLVIEDSTEEVKDLIVSLCENSNGKLLKTLSMSS